jgi:hypothetical protein
VRFEQLHVILVAQPTIEAVLVVFENNPLGVAQRPAQMVEGRTQAIAELRGGGFGPQCQANLGLGARGMGYQVE